ncbi:hypothetical protein [Microbacterium paraoxydans]|uniref:Lipoprotein LpqB beta-propeller domain-containing protein n=1 Tax=Microbacterium paraoxydans TaxID=199592 RepID=A0A1H1WAP1_9MICO|nr:hypothetical protein [Microbacterium paraoxydans]SDS93741.1 hypothetical protein SAMN04489809_3066 [Microbacterium paraoxydans]
MRRPSSLLLALAATALAVTACAPATSAEPSASPRPSETTSASPTPTETASAHIVVSLDGLTVTGAEERSADYTDSAAILELLQEVTGELPEPEGVEIFPGEASTLEAYDWEGLRVLADSTGEAPASVSVTAAEVAGLPITTEDGFRVGSTRAELRAADAWALTDAEDPETASELGLGGREVPDTESLTRPGSTGIIYTMFVLDGDTVTQIMVPANDFSDL